MKNYDYIIVGAGSAGCVLAYRLTENTGLKVLVLEAGGRDLHPFVHMPLTWRMIWRGPLYNWMYYTEPEPYCDGRKLLLPRGKVLGGSSTINGLLYMRGNPRDYDHWRQLGLYGWSYADVLPYFKRSENNWRGEGKFHGAGGPLQVTPVDTKHYGYEPLKQAALNAGHVATADFADNPEGFNRLDVTVGKGRRSSSARAFLYPAMKRPNLTVEISALTHRVIVENNRAVGVEYSRDGQVHTAYAEREVILSGGAYNSPQLLMLSGIGGADELKAHGIAPVLDLPPVGKNLSEHPICAVGFEASQPTAFLSQIRFDRLAFEFIRYALTRTGNFANQVITANAFVRTRPEVDTPDMQLFFGPVKHDARVWMPLIRKPVVHAFGGAASLLRPESRGHLALRSVKPTDHPRITLNFFQQQSDLDAMRRGLRMIREIYATEPQASLVKQELYPGVDVKSDDEIDAYLRRAVEVGHHPVGTCSMGIDENAVVDPELRVRGIDALRVVDASVMPTVPSGNTNAPTIMIAEKASDMILGRAPLRPAEL